VAASDHNEIRQAAVGDAADIARLLHDFNTEYDEPTPGVAALTERIRELLTDEAITVLIAGDPPQGLALFRTRPSLWSTATDVYLEELYVAPQQRGQGIGRALLNAAVDTARESGANHFELTTGETDTEARALYESTGMTNHEGSPDGPRMLYYELDL
jgi:GNAT superfamily N-acetyltransferase